MSTIAADIKDYIDERDGLVEERVKAWLVKAVLIQVVSFIPVIFFLGGIYFQNNAALELLRNQQRVIETRGKWMSDRERWEQAVEQQWPGPRQFSPPRYDSRK